MTRNRWVIVLGAGALIAATGIVLALTRPAFTGWIAYSPLSSEQYLPPGFPGVPLVVDLLLVAAGAFVAGAAAASLRRRP